MNIGIRTLLLLSFVHAALIAESDHTSINKDQIMTQTQQITPELIQETAQKVVGRVIKRDRVWGNYCLDLCLESMLVWGQAAETAEYDEYVLGVMERRDLTPHSIIKYENQPFGHMNYALYISSQNQAYAEGFVLESRRFQKEVPRSSDGLVLLRDNTEDRNNVIIDFMHDYASRMAETGALTGEEHFYKECVDQFRLYRSVLRHDDTHLWSTGRGWLEDEKALSPGHWSRGHGWLVRGMIHSLSVLPKKSEYYKELNEYFIEIIDALLLVQDEKGMWHQLLHRPFADSYPDSSGTGLICYAISVAIQKGILVDEKYRIAAEKAFIGLQDHISEEGIVHHVCYGPGPLRVEEDYVNAPGHDDDGKSHGAMAVIFACAGMQMLYSGQ